MLQTYENKHEKKILIYFSNIYVTVQYELKSQL